MGYGATVVACRVGDECDGAVCARIESGLTDRKDGSVPSTGSRSLNFCHFVSLKRAHHFPVRPPHRDFSLGFVALHLFVLGEFDCGGGLMRSLKAKLNFDPLSPTQLTLSSGKPTTKQQLA